MTAKPNRYAARCRDCGVFVDEGQGIILREQQEDGTWHSIVTHKGACPPPPKSQNGRSGEQRAFDAMVARQTPTELGEANSEAGRQWLGYIYFRGIRPKPMDVEDLDAMIGEANLEAMDALVAEWRARILERDSMHDPLTFRPRGV